MVRRDAQYLHLTPVAVWQRQLDGDQFLPDSYAADGFIHLTIGEENLIQVGNRYYYEDPREHVALMIDPSKLTAPVRFDDDSGRYPHLYGPLNVDAVIEVRPVSRGADGAFIAVLAVG